MKSPKQYRPEKKGSFKAGQWLKAFQFGLNRRVFLKHGLAATFIALLPGTGHSKDNPEDNANVTIEPSTANSHFNSEQQALLNNVFNHLFPDDGNGPSAKQLNTLGYLNYALTDPINIEDGDLAFIIEGISKLNELANAARDKNYLTLDQDDQALLLKKLSQTRAGENWLSLLLYYLIESLLLDPVYGGNTDQIGWEWLQHQPGFPRPVLGKTYCDFE